jgi:DNA-binding MarR family transcriptional regulator/GNAT superfamily N-acetyltransferase
MSTEPADARVAAVRRFNRFYTKQIGALNRGFLDSEFSLSQVRVLYELRHHEGITATEIANGLGIDAAYLSRMLREFERGGLVVKTLSPSDGRQRLLRLSAKGKRVFDSIEARQHAAVADMLRELPREQQRHVVQSMEKIEQLLAAPPGDEASYTLRDLRPGDLGWIIHRQGVLYHEEYGWDATFEALVAQIAADFVQHHDPQRERCWVAEFRGETVGSIFCVKKSKTVAKLRLLYVEPSARRLGIGTRLVEECIAFARSAGYRRMTLWTQSILVAARRVYERAGFTLVHEEPHRSFGADLVAQTWEKDL